MPKNVLTAIRAIVEHNRNVLQNEQEGVHNRANQMGDALEGFVKNAFANCLEKDQITINKERSETFSYLGNSNNPPDAMIRQGDAIEIKKVEKTETKKLQLNSSYPKNKLHSNNPKISSKCRECEEWEEKDMLYVVGLVNGSELHDIFFIYGDLYCDSHEVYENVESVIKNGIESLGDVELAETKELGRVNKVDHLEISDLRVRGMWLIESPFQHFSYLIKDIHDYTFRMIALIPLNKYLSFEDVNDFEVFCRDNNVNVTEVEVPNPQNPAELVKSKLITYSY